MGKPPSFLSKVADKFVEYWVGVCATTLFALSLFVAKKISQCITKTLTLPIWGLCLGGYVIVFLAVVAVIQTVRIRKGNKPPAPPKKEKWEDYTHDTFLGIDWHWSYAGDRIREFRMICPKCQGAVNVAGDPLIRALATETNLKCRNCDLSVEVRCEETEVGELLADHISQVIRKNGWGPPGFAIRA